MWPFFRRRRTPEELESRQDALERAIAAVRGDFAGWELRLTELTTKLSNQLRRMAQIEQAAQRRLEREETREASADDSTTSIGEALKRFRGGGVNG